MKKLSEKFTFKAFLYLIPLSLSVCIIGNVIACFVPGSADNEVSNEIYEMLSNGEMMEAIMIVGIAAPIIEELFFRFFLYYLANRFFGYKVAIVFTALLFAILHLNIEQGIYALIAGLVLGYVRYRYDSVLCTIFMHLLMNVAVVVFANYFAVENSFKEILFVFFIGVSMFLFSIYRINNIFNERRI